MPEKLPFSQWRKIAMATWRPVHDPMIRATLDVDAEALLHYLEEVREATGVHVTPMHLVGRAVARTIAQVPGINGRIIAGTYLPSPTIDIFFTVSLRTDLCEDGEEAAATDLSGAVVRRVDELTPWELAQALCDKAERIRHGHDPLFRRTKQLTQLLPSPVLRPFLALTTFITEDLQLPVPPLGLEARPFGSFLITNVGTFGLDSSFAALPPVCHTPGAVIVGRVTDKPVVRDGQVVARKILPLAVVIDHRYIDGYQGAVLAGILRSYLEDPAATDPVPVPRRRHTRKLAAAV